MEDGAKYVIHAKLTADGVVERSDVVGAVFGQTEGLLGEDLALPDLQEAGKVSRIAVDVESEGGQAFADITIASDLDKVETAILAASLETIDRVGPCLATVSVARIEDVRSAKRREVVDRAKELLATTFDEGSFDSEALVEEVRESLRVADLAEYAGLPAGPNVAESDAVIVVEGRADVARLLGFGIKNAVAVEGTNVPEAVAELSRERTVTAFLDADRGGDLILEELRQVGEVDFVARPPEGKPVEDLTRAEVYAALQGKGPLHPEEAEAYAATDGSATPAPESEPEDPAALAAAAELGRSGPDASGPTAPPTDPPNASSTNGTTELTEGATEPADDTIPPEDDATESPTDATENESAPGSIREHVEATVAAGTGEVVLLDDEFGVIDRAAAADAFDAVAEAEPVPTVVVLDGELTQRVLDVAAQRGVGQVVARELGSFTKRPASVRVREADAVLPAE